MKLPRFSIAELMVVVAFVGANIVAVQPLLRSHGLDLVLAVAPIGITLQVGFWQLYRRRGKGLAFWAGFLVSGTYTLATLLICYYDPSWLRPAYSYLGASFWPRYWAWTERLIREIPGGLSFFRANRVAWFSFSCILYFIPHILAATIGGMATQRIARLVSNLSPAPSGA